MALSSRKVRRQAAQLERWRSQRERDEQRRATRRAAAYVGAVLLAALVAFGVGAARAATPSEHYMTHVMLARMPIGDSELAWAVAARTLLNAMERSDAPPAQVALGAVQLTDDQYRHDNGQGFVDRLERASGIVAAVTTSDPAKFYTIEPSKCAHGTLLLFQRPGESEADFGARVVGLCRIGNMAVLP